MNKWCGLTLNIVFNLELMVYHHGAIVECIVSCIGFYMQDELVSTFGFFVHVLCVSVISNR